MPTNKEWLYSLEPHALTEWFESEHGSNDTLAAEKVVSGDAAHSNDGNAHLKACEDLSDGFTDSREKLEADITKQFSQWFGNSPYPSQGHRVAAGWLDRQVEITKTRMFAIIDELKAECAECVYKQEFDDIDRLKTERDNLAADLLTCNREREHLREHLGIALDHAHDICSLVDIDGNVLDVGE